MKLFLFDFRIEQICFEPRNYYCLTSECSKSVLKQEIALICLTLECHKSVLKQEIAIV